MQKKLAEIFDLRRYRDKLLKKIKKFGTNFQAHTPSFTHLTETEVHYLDNLDHMREIATQYATGKVQTKDPKHLALIKDYLKMEMLDLSIRNERVALLDEITRAHAMLNNISTDTYPDARFVYPDTHHHYTAYVNVLKNDTI